MTPRRPDAAAALGLACAALATVFAWHYAVDWFYNDDLATLRWFSAADAGLLRPWDLIDLWNNEHPVGSQFALQRLARLAFGLDMRAFVLLSVCVVSVTAAIAARLAADAGDPLPARCAAVAACFALAFHPAQTEHLLWSFELGWFVVNAVVVADVALAERFGPRAAWPSFLLCGAAALASAQGSLSFFAAAAHQALLSRRRGRTAAGCILAAGGVLAIAHLWSAPHPSASGSARPDTDVVGMALYAIQIWGGFLGTRDHVALALFGIALLAGAGLLLWRRRHSSRRDRWRAAAVLIGFSALCVAAFTRARHHLGIDWATLTFHAAPLLTPFALGLVVLAGAPADLAEPRTATSRRPWRIDAVAVAGLLAAATAAASPYGVMRADLWAMDLGYARWAACSNAVPDAVAARASGLTHDVAGFSAARPQFERMCFGRPGPLEGALVRRPALFDALAERRPALDRALDALWQLYATDLRLQLAFKPRRADTPQRLLAFAGADAEKSSESDPGLLAEHREALRTLAP